MSTPTDEQSQGIWLTQEAHDRLKAELDQLVAGRPAMSAEINARREEGDLKENGGYHAAKDEQGKQEARIRQLTDLLRKATVGEAPKEVSNAATGTVITVPVAAWVTFVGGSPTVALRSRSVSWRMRASCLPCSSLAAW